MCMSFDEMPLSEQEDAYDYAVNASIRGDAWSARYYGGSRLEGMKSHLETVYAGMDYIALTGHLAEVGARHGSGWRVKGSPATTALVAAQIAVRDAAAEYVRGVIEAAVKEEKVMADR